MEADLLQYIKNSIDDYSDGNDTDCAGKLVGLDYEPRPSISNNFGSLRVKLYDGDYSNKPEAVYEITVRRVG